MEVVEAESTRYSTIPKVLKVAIFVLSLFVVLLAAYYLFGVVLFNFVLIEAQFYYLVIAACSFCAFVILPARKKDVKVPWYDILAAILIFVIAFYFSTNAWDISNVGWMPPSPMNMVLAIIFILLIFEEGRRTGGPIFLAIVIFFAAYPLFGSYMPGIFWAFSETFGETIGSLVFTTSGMLGIPTKVLAEILIGYLLLAGFLLASGAGDFFIKLALVVLGKYRGGPAKVSVFASALFGTLEGTIVANIAGTGTFTIPTMKRIGYPPHYAAAVEACASTGGVIMPPVMGAVAFIACDFIGIEYARFVVAAAIPAILYFFGLLMQVDAHAAKAGIKGVPKEEIPPLGKTLAQGWPYIIVLLFLIFGLMYLRLTAQTPFYATLLLILLSFSRKETRLTPDKLVRAMFTVGRLINQTAAILFPIGFIYCGLTMTGVSGSFTGGLVQLGMGNVVFILILGIIACYIMGMAGMLTAAYIFLAVSLIPAVMKVADLNLLALHLFVIYYSMLAAITPPVATGAFVAAAIAKADPMKTAWQATRLAVVIYFIPFYFVFNPALVLQGGSPLTTLGYFALCIIGIILISGGIEGYLLKVGMVHWWARAPLVIAGLLIALPEWITTVIGAVLALLTIAIMLSRKRLKPATA